MLKMNNNIKHILVKLGEIDCSLSVLNPSIVFLLKMKNIFRHLPFIYRWFDP
jgi:hypothetical protein